MHPMRGDVAHIAWRDRDARAPPRADSGHSALLLLDSAPGAKLYEFYGGHATSTGPLAQVAPTPTPQARAPTGTSSEDPCSGRATVYCLDRDTRM